MTSIIAMIMLCCGLAVAQTPTTITYQGRLTDAVGNPVVDGIYAVTFRLFDVPAGGSPLWTEPGLLVTVSKGLFTASLGSPTTFPSGSLPGPVYTLAGPDYTFATSPELWLELEVGGTPLSPRSKLESVPYSISAGSLHGKNQTDPDVSMNITPEYATIITRGWDAEEKVRIWGPGWGEIFLHDAGPIFGTTSERTVSLSATQNSGGELDLGNNAGTTTLSLDGGATSDLSAVLPDSAINSNETLNEPGIAANQASSTTVLSGSTATDILTVNITIPAPGYIVVDARYYGLTSGTTGDARAWTQIDETAGGSYVLPYWSVWGALDFSSTAFRFHPGSVYRIYYKSTPGTYTFRLEGAVIASSAGAAFSVNFPMIKATYYASSYGSVATSAPVPPGDHPDVAVENATDPISGQTTATYKYDLRHYEIQAQKARAAALKAELELEQARKASTSQVEIGQSVSPEN